MATSKFLDYTGLQHFYENLLKKFPEGEDFGDGFVVTKDENGNITAVTLNLGDGFEIKEPANPGDPKIIEVDTGDLFVDMYDEYDAPQTDSDNDGKQILRIDSNYLQFTYPDPNKTELSLTVKVGGVGSALADTYTPDPQDPTVVPTPGAVYYNTTTHKLGYVLPAASDQTRGGITVGDGLEIKSGTTDNLQAKVDGITIEIDSNSKALKIKDNAFCPLQNVAPQGEQPDYKVPTSYLPSYVDDVIEGYYRPADPTAQPPVAEGFFANRTGSGTPEDPYKYTDPITGEASKIYVDVSNGNTYRWSGSTWVEIGSGSIDVITNNEIDTIMGLNVQENGGE